jgi:cation:H+ antiporter
MIEIINWIQGLNPLFFLGVVILLSLIIVIKSSGLLVYGISDYAKKLGISDYITGFIVVSIGTALPELIAAVTGAALGQGKLVFGTIFGSNIFKIPLLGGLLLIVKKIKTRNDVGGAAPITTLFIALLPFLLVIDRRLGRIDGVILLLAFLFYIFKLWKGEGEMGKLKKNVKLASIWKDGLIFIGSLVALLLSARWLVFSSISISSQLRISPYLIGLLIIGVGASLPELMVQYRSIRKHHQNMATGNVLGSIVTNSTFVLGVAALIAPFNISIETLILTFIFMMVGLLYTLIVMLKDKVTWKHGLVMVSIYVLFLIFEVVL